MRFLFTKTLLTAIACTSAITTQAQLVISEVHPTGSSSSTYASDWFEIRNIGVSTIDLSGWKVDDSNPTFASAVALRGVGSLVPGQIAVFMESDAAGANDATKGAAFVSAWFGSSVPVGFTLGFYGGSGIGLGSGGDAVNLFDAGGSIVAGVSFGAATAGVTFDNSAGLGGAISQLSAVGVNGAFNSVTGGEIGSPGIVVVPEPTVMTFGLLGLAGTVLWRRLLCRR